MLQNNIELDLKTKLIESSTTQTEMAEKVGVSLAYVNRITKGREQIVNKTFVKMMDELAMAGIRAGICGGEPVEKWNKTRSGQHSSNRGI